VVLGQVLDDDRRLGDGSIRRFVAKHGKLSDGPELLERRALRLVREIDEMRLERGVVFVEGNQDLLTKRRQRVEVERERHGLFSPF
jgi:hypothetical protein